MGDLAVDTEIEGGDGRYRAVLSSDWEIWGPCGGYLAAVLLRAAGVHSQFRQPATFACHFLGAARFDEVELETATLRASRRTESIRVAMRQEGRPIAEAMVWTVAESDGFEHDWTEPPAVGRPQDTPTIEEQIPDWEPWYPFWNNVEYRPLGWMSEEEWEARRPLQPRYQAWVRYRPTAVFEDPFVEAGRVALLVDIMGWPAAHRALDDEAWIAPNLDVNVTFHQSPAGADYLYLDSEASLAIGGLVGSTGRIWSADGRLLASGTQQMMCRPVPVPD